MNTKLSAAAVPSLSVLAGAGAGTVSLSVFLSALRDLVFTGWQDQEVAEQFQWLQWCMVTVTSLPSYHAEAHIVKCKTYVSKFSH